MCITYSVLSCKLATSFRVFQFSFFEVETAIHYVSHAIFQDTEHQLRENILHHSLHFNFL